MFIVNLSNSLLANFKTDIFYINHLPFYLVLTGLWYSLHLTNYVLCVDFFNTILNLDIYREMESIYISIIETKD